MRVVQYVELDLPRCSRTYGSAPCTASVGVTGDDKCFNSKLTCQDRANYAETTVTVRFCVPTSWLPRDIDADPRLLSFSVTPATVSLGEGLGERGSLTIELQDGPHPDTGEAYDKYHADRAYDPWIQGTLFGKLSARYPNLRGVLTRFYVGEESDALADMEVRHYVVDDFNGPTRDARFTITGKDPLKLIDDERAVAPLASLGRLSVGVTATDTTLTLAPTGAGSDYDPTGYASIGAKEVVAFARDVTVGNNSNTVLLISGEGTNGSTTIPDSSSAAHGNATVSGNAQISTTRKKFGASSVLCDGTGDGISFADHADWTQATNNWTIEGQFYFASLASNMNLIGHIQAALTDYWLLSVESTGLVRFKIQSSGGGVLLNLASATGTVVTGQFYHIAAERSTGNVWGLYVNGVRVATSTTSLTVPNYAASLYMGISNTGGSSLNGNFDEVRLSKVARFGGVTSFTPPVAGYHTSADIMEITRAQYSTTATTHNTEDRVQECLLYTGEDPADIVYDLETTYSAIDPSWITLADWQLETGTYFGQVLTAIIAEPTSVRQLVAEILVQAALVHYWDDRSQQLKLRVLRSLVPNALTHDENILLSGSFRVTEQLDKRVSQAWVYYGQKNPLTTLDDASNYRSVVVDVDTDSEDDYGTPAIREYHSRWIPALGESIASRLAEIVLARYSVPPRQLTYDLPRGPVQEPVLAVAYNVEHRLMQNPNGSTETVLAQITRLRPDPEKFAIELEESRFNVPASDLTYRTISIDADDFNLDMLSIHDSIYAPATSGVTVELLIQPDVVVGSHDVTVPAIIVSAGWAAGVIVKVLNYGRIQGRGGDGLEGGGPSGQNGGVALYTRHAVTVTNNGEMWGGGGGSGLAGGVRFGGAGTDPGDNGTTLATSEDGGTLGGTASGGDPGQNGNNGGGGHTPGNAGAAVDGTSYVTYAVAGSRLGPLIN